MARPKKEAEENSEKKTTARKTATRKTTTTTRKSAKEKEQEEEIKKANEKIDEQEKEISNLVDLIKDMKSEIDNLKNSNNNNSYVNKDNAMFKRVKCVNTINSILQVSTRSDGTGRLYTFRNYGESLLIRLDELTDIYATCPEIIRNGYLYICDRDAIELLGLEDIYDNLYNSNEINKIVELSDELSIDKIKATNKSLRDEILGMIIKNIAKGKVYDLNKIGELNKTFDIDINKLASEYKDVYVDSNIDR